MNLGTAVGYLELDTSKFQSGLKTAQSQFKGFMDTSQSAGSRITNLGNSLKSMGSTLTKNVTLPLAALGTGAVTVAANFEKGMSQVAATMGMTAEEVNGGSKAFEDLKKAAEDAGRSTQFSASESAEALNYLALAGYDAEKAIETLPTVLNLAASGGLELGYASDIMTDAMSALGDTAGTAENFVDKLAKTASKSNTSVGQLGEAILTVGGTAKVLAGGTTELNTALGILADNGIKGAEGGTALRNIILALTPSTDKAVAAFKKLGVETYDANGNLKPLNETFAEMEGKLKNLSQEERTRVLSDIFNKVDLKSVNALLANSGERFDELSGYIANADGAASDMAETMNNNLSGQLTLLKSALEGAGITIGNALLPVIKEAVSSINGLVDWFNKLNPSIQTTIVVIGGIAAAIGPVLLIFGNLVLIITKMSKGISLLSAFLNNKLLLAFTSLQVKMTTLIIPALTNFASIISGAITTAITTVSSFITGTLIPAFVSFAGILKGAVLGAIKGVATFITGTLIPALTATAFSIGAVTVPVWAVIAVFAALVAAGVAVYKNWDVIKAKCVEIWQGSIKPAIINAANTIKSAVTSAWNGIKSTVSSVSNAIKSAVTTTWNTIKSVITNALNTIKSAVTTTWNTIKNVISNALNGIKSVVSSAWNSIKSVITSVLNTIKSIVSSTWNNVRSTTSSILNGIKGVVSSVFNGIVTSISSSLSKAFSTAKDWWEKIKAIFANPIKAVVNVFKNEGKAIPAPQADTSLYARNNVMDVAKEMTYARNATDASISRSIESTLSLSDNLLKRNVAKGSSSNNVTINNTYNSPKPASIRELKRQDEIQMRRLAMQLGF